jgi:hypothetical protein
VGKEGRRKFEKFLREVGVDEEDDDAIDVESKIGLALLTAHRQFSSILPEGSGLKLVGRPSNSLAHPKSMNMGWAGSNHTQIAPADAQKGSDIYTIGVS